MGPEASGWEMNRKQNSVCLFKIIYINETCYLKSQPIAKEYYDAVTL